MGTVCPQCGNTDAVHSIQELATLARARMGQQGPMGPQPGTPAQPQPAPTQPAQKIRMHYITSNERTNTVLVTGPAAPGQDKERS